MQVLNHFGALGARLLKLCSFNAPFQLEPLIEHFQLLIIIQYRNQQILQSTCQQEKTFKNSKNLIFKLFNENRCFNKHSSCKTSFFPVTCPMFCF